jgi:1-acyl-sn-glycerol-3-phosphate acyltransferase
VIWIILRPFIIVFCVLWTIICFVISFIFRIVTFSEYTVVFLAKYLWGPGLLFFSGILLKVRGTENVSKDRNFIFVSNHQSLLDIIVLFVSSPTFMYFIAKHELKKMPIVGWGIKATGMIYIDRSQRKGALESMRMAGDKAKNQKKNIVTFAEGSRSEVGKIGKFKRGAFFISKESDLDIIPVAIKDTGKHWPLKSLKVRGGRVNIIYGEPISPQDHLEKSTEEYAVFVQKEVERLYASIQ